jgi:large subunit ribosomal protein L21
VYAIFETGGKQYRAAERDVIMVEKLPVDVGDTVEFDRVFAAGEGDDLTVGTPLVDGAKVVGRAVAQERRKKIRGFKYRPKKNYRRTWGHRQYVTKVLIESIEL